MALGADIPDEVLGRLRPISETVTFLERQLPRVDIARFDGRTVHPVNLASVLLNDSARARGGPRLAGSDGLSCLEAAIRRGTPAVILAPHTPCRRQRCGRGAEVFAERLQSGLKPRA